MHTHGYIHTLLSTQRAYLAFALQLRGHVRVQIRVEPPMILGAEVSVNAHCVRGGRKCRVGTGCGWVWMVVVVVVVVAVVAGVEARGREREREK